MKQVYVSDEVSKLIQMLPRGSRIRIIDTILKRILSEVVDKAKLSDLQDDTFPIFLEKLLKEISKDELVRKEEKNAKKHIRTRTF